MPWQGRTRPALLAVLVLTALLASLTTACNGGDGDGAPDDARQMLQRMVLQPSQVPTGMERTDSRFTTNETLANASEDPDRELARLNELGRILSHAVFYAATAESPIAGIQNTATLFETAAGASESFASAAQEAREVDWAAEIGLYQLETEEIEREDLADGVVWIRNTGFQGEEDGSNQPLIVNDDILLLRGRSRGFARVLTMLPDAADRYSNVDEVAALIGVVVANIDAVLAEEG